jgi:hypothetical protein
MEDVDMKVDPATNRPYYFNKRTSVSGWSVAEVLGSGGVGAPPPPPSGGGAAEPHIEEHFDPGRRQSYFVNTSTGQTGWAREEVGGATTAAASPLAAGMRASYHPGTTAAASPLSAPSPRSMSMHPGMGGGGGGGGEAHIEEKFDHTRRQSYFVNKQTGQSGWSRAEVGGTDGGGMGGMGGGSGVKQVMDPGTGRPFYVNEATGATGWSEAEALGHSSAGPGPSAPPGNPGGGNQHLDTIRAKAELDEHRRMEAAAQIGGSRAQAEAWTPVMSAGEEAAAAINKAESEAQGALVRANEMVAAARARAEMEAQAAMKHAEELAAAARRRAVERAQKARQRAELEVAERRKVYEERCEEKRKAEEAAASVVRRAKEELQAREEAEKMALKALQEAEQVAVRVREAEQEAANRPLENFVSGHELGGDGFNLQAHGALPRAAAAKPAAPDGVPPPQVPGGTAPVSAFAEAQAGAGAGEAAPAEAAPAAEGDEEKAAEGAEAADPKAKTKLTAPAMGAPAADFVNQLYENTKEYSFVDEAEKAMGIKVELAEELALFTPEDLMRCGMKKLKIRPFVNNVHKLEGFPQIDFTKVDCASWEALLKSEAVTGDGAVAEAVLKEAGELAAATKIVGEAAAISAAGKSECTECNNGSNTESDQKHAKFTTSPWTCCTACALGKRANLYDQLKKAGVAANAALRVLGALKVHSAAA